ncbi:CBL-interacting protein kinase 24-like [Magnolia sinica]|uniref:CBL-interacting protein kinase 24-like n=1 Tax=Magnolia sinica TaxID=86752 RepID=UPI0026588A14|nr:CBL-interacting protein kinase 24-like [Magnolia sinica]
MTSPSLACRIKIEGIRSDEWLKKNYMAVRHGEEEEVNLDDVHAVFDDIEDQYVSEQMEVNESGPLIMNAFEMITLSQGLNLSALFDRHQDYVKQQTRFISCKPAKTIISTVEVIPKSMGLAVHSRNYKMGLEGISANKTGQFAVVLEILITDATVKPITDKNIFMTDAPIDLLFFTTMVLNHGPHMLSENECTAVEN